MLDCYLPIIFQGEREAPIVLTSAETLSGQPEPRSIRLVDGPSPLEGRIQLLHQGEWRSVCTNSRKYARHKIYSYFVHNY